MLLHDLLDSAGGTVAVAAGLTSALALWSLAPRPRRVLARLRGRS